MHGALQFECYRTGHTTSGGGLIHTVVGSHPGVNYICTVWPNSATSCYHKLLSKSYRQAQEPVVLMILLSRGAQVPHDVHGLHGTIHHMAALHKLLCGLPVDDL